jgi:adenylyltransferase/sulfurtransferase
MITHHLLLTSSLNVPDSRYSRQSRFAPLGDEGQQRIRSSRVAIVGCGALGSVQAELLTRAGVGFIRLIDRDFVELSNLQRQFLFDESDARDALPKAAAAARRLAQINSDVRIEPAVADLTASNAEKYLSDVDLILDATDNFDTRYLINDVAVKHNVAWIYGAAVGSYGLKLAIVPTRTACFRCVYPDPPDGVQPTCETAGVLGPVTATIASLQCADAIKYLSTGDVTRALTTIDLWTGQIRQIDSPQRDPVCVCCARHRFEALAGSEKVSARLCGRDAVQIHDRNRPLDLAALAAELRRAGEVRTNEYAVRLILDSYEMTIFHDGRAIIKGTTDPAVARSLYARYIGG